ncbi:MAG: ATP-grasp domain-containing protein [Synergistaceae bacterium]|nr:ATP-grasp domain-containing protein [Synergistaceae bacterium]
MNLLFTSVGRRSYLIQYFKEALNGEGIIHAANSEPHSPAFEYADRNVVTPIIYDKSYIQFMLDYCLFNNIDALIPLFDIDLPILSTNRHLFENIGVRLILSGEEAIGICNDKWHTYNFCRENNIAVPKTYLSLEDALCDVAQGKISFPVIIKPRWGMGSIAVFEADDESELRVLYRKAQKKIISSYLKYETHNRLDKGVLIQEKLNGQEYGMDVINDLNGRYQNTIVKKKYSMRSGETDCAETVDNIILKNLGCILSQRLKHIAILDVDLFMVGDTPYLLEMNARFGGGYPFSHLAGVNLPLAIIKWLNNEQISKTILHENFGIVSHKNLNVIQISSHGKCYLGDKYNVKIVKSQYDISNLLLKFNNYFYPTLLDKIENLDNYVNKLQNNAIVLRITDVNDNIRAFASFYANDTMNYIAYLTIIAVDESVQRHGIGKLLLTKVEEISRTNGMKYVKLSTHNFNTTAIAFYGKNGYTVSEYLVDGNIYMIKKLV